MSVRGEEDNARKKHRPGQPMVARNRGLRKRPRLCGPKMGPRPPDQAPWGSGLGAALKSGVGFGCRSGRPGHVLGAPSGTRAAHIMQFRAVGVERPGEEMLPESPEFSERPGVSVAAVRRGGKGRRSDRCHDAGLCFSSRLWPLGACFCAENQFWPDLLKEGFNCRDLVHTWYRPRIHPW